MVSGLDRFGLLDKVIRISNSTVDVNRRLQNLLQLLRRELVLERIWLFNLERQENRLSLRVAENGQEPPDMHIELGDHFLNQAVQDRQPVIVNPDSMGDIPKPYSSFFENCQLLAAFPIQDDQVLYGILVLFDNNSGEAYSPERIALLETVSREMAGTIRNARLYSESKKRIAELSVLYEVGRAVSSTIELDTVLRTVVNITAKVLQAEGCALNVLNTSDNHLMVSADYGFIPLGCRFRSAGDESNGRSFHQPLSCLDRHEPYVGLAKFDPDCEGMQRDGGDKSLICLPLSFKGHFKGALSVYNKMAAPPGQPREFTHEDLELLSTMGTMIASSLENALTFQSVEELARSNEALVHNLQGLYDISGAMMTTVKTNELLTIIIRALTVDKGLGFDRALILLLDEKGRDLKAAAYQAVPSDINEEAEKRPLPELLRIHEVDDEVSGSKLPPGLSDLTFPIDASGGILARCVREMQSCASQPGEALSDIEEGLRPWIGRKAVAVVPMLTKGEVVGVIAVDRELTERELTSEDMQNLSMLANQAGLAIENSRLYEYIERTNQALRETRERLIESEKMAALGEMAAGMAHEIRNPLVSIGGFTRRLLKSLDEKAPQRVYVQVIINEVARLEKTLSEILDFSRDSMGHLDERNISGIIDEALALMTKEFQNSHVEVFQEYEETSTVLVDDRQIRHVFINLFYNACQAMESGGSITVRTYQTKVDDREFVACEISDTGPGIQPEILPNIFNPFFTTKDVGTGLGLSIVHKIITRHHGFIDVVNTENRGATFIVKLPAAGEAGFYLK